MRGEEGGEEVKKNDRPSQNFMGAILRGYDKEAVKEGPVTCAGIWNQVTMECLRMRGGFTAMFQWDTSRAKSINRIGTIAEVIERFMGTMLVLEKDERGKKIVVEVKP